MVLYGRNASGKSTVLRSLAETLSGGSTPGAESRDLVHVRAVGPLDRSGGLGFWLRRLVRAHAEREETNRALRDLDATEPADPDAPEPPDAGATIEQLVAYCLRCDGAGEELAVPSHGRTGGP